MVIHQNVTQSGGRDNEWVCWVVSRVDGWVAEELRLLRGEQEGTGARQEKRDIPELTAPCKLHVNSWLG